MWKPQKCIWKKNSGSARTWMVGMGGHIKTDANERRRTMGRARKKEYIDVSLKPKELIKIKKGYKVIKVVKGQNISVHIEGKDRKTEKEIQRLKKKIKELEAKK
jgi:hypothetical protein